MSLVSLISAESGLCAALLLQLRNTCTAFGGGKMSSNLAIATPKIGPPVFSQQQVGNRTTTSTMSGRDLLSATSITFSPVTFQQQWPQEVEISVEGSIEELPRALRPALTLLGELLSLPPGWNSYGSRPIRRSIVAVAANLLSEIMLEDTPVPDVVPTYRGGVQLEWHRASVDIEILFESPTHVSFSLDADGKEITGALPEEKSLLRSYIERISAGD